MDYPADDAPVIDTRPAMWSREVRLDTSTWASLIQ
jgi:hypothetical protein